MLPSTDCPAVLEILEAFGACGYDVSWRVVNARRWLPQYRERVYLVGLRSDLGCAPLDWRGLCYEGSSTNYLGDGASGEGDGRGGGGGGGGSGGGSEGEGGGGGEGEGEW